MRQNQLSTDNAVSFFAGSLPVQRTRTITGGIGAGTS
jgi:hypothetical protein